MPGPRCFVVLLRHGAQSRGGRAQHRAKKPGIVFSLLYVDTAGGAPVSSDLRAAHRMFCTTRNFHKFIKKVLCACVLGSTSIANTQII